MKHLLSLFCFLLLSLTTFAEIPTHVSNVPRRYVLISEWDNELLLKGDTRTGKVWFIIVKKDATVSNLREYSNIPVVDESQSYDGRFVFLPTTTIGGGWKMCLMMDSKTGQLWQLNFDKNKFEAVEIKNHIEE